MGDGMQPLRGHEPITLEEVKKLTLEPGDVLVLRVGDDLSMAEMARMREELSEEFQDHRVLCLVGAVDLEVVRRTEEAAGG